VDARNYRFARGALQFANRLAGSLDGLAASEEPGSTAPIMIVGLPRSGTTLTYELLVQAFEVGYLTRAYGYAYGMPNVLTRFIAPRILNPGAQYTSDYGHIPGRFKPAENATIWNRWFMEHRLLGHYVPPSAITDRHRQACARMLSSMSAIAQRPYVFKNIYMTLSLPAFVRLVPESRIVVVRRKIETAIASLYKRRRSLGYWWSIRPPFAQDVYGKSMLEQTAFQCVRSEQLLDDALSLVPAANILEVDYEEICAATGAFVDNVASWVGPEFRLRSKQDIPATFEVSRGPGLDGERNAELAETIRGLEQTRAQYLSRLNEYVAKMGAVGGGERHA